MRKWEMGGVFERAMSYGTISGNKMLMKHHQMREHEHDDGDLRNFFT
jgi:hypothetical protein